jgi:hypothetical protein
MLMISQAVKQGNVRELFLNLFFYLDYFLRAKSIVLFDFFFFLNSIIDYGKLNSIMQTS